MKIEVKVDDDNTIINVDLVVDDKEDLIEYLENVVALLRSPCFNNIKIK